MNTSYPRRTIILSFLVTCLSMAGCGQDPEFEKIPKKVMAGDAEAEFNLGLKHYRGTGVPQDYAEAAKWFRSAAEQGHAWAAEWLGVMHYEGEGVPQDYAEAYVWLKVASVLSTSFTHDYWGMAEAQLTPEARTAAARRAKELHAEIEKRKHGAE